jgi:NifU-like protein involved in Fe-S cluster formation
MGDDSAVAFYNEELIKLSGQAAVPKALEKPDREAKAVSPICGSEVTVQLKLDGEIITGFGFEVEACALTRAVVAVMAKAIIGKTRHDVSMAGEDLEEMLDGKAVIPTGDWERLVILAPVKDYKARHNAILLPFEAVEKAFNSKK